MGANDRLLFSMILLFYIVPIELRTVIVTSTLEVPVLLVVSVHTTVRMTDDGMAPLSML